MSPCYPRRFFLIQALLLYTFVVREAAPTSLKHRRASVYYQSLPQNQGHYNSSDDVVVLNSGNFKSSVFGSGNAWLVEFYNSWCGFCQRFAPTWKALANDIRTWRDVVTVAALNCADDNNNPLCREYEIMRYPEVRYFAPGEKITNLGVDVEKANDVDTIRRNLVLRLRKEQQEGRGSEWPNITPFRSSEVKDMWEGAPSSAKYFLFLFEEVNSTLGAELILDFRNVTSLVIRSVTSDNGPLCLVHRITRFPSLVVYGRNGTQERLAIRVPTRQRTRKVVEDFAGTKGIDTSAIDYIPEDFSKPTIVTTPPKTIEEEFNNSSTVSMEKGRERSWDVLHRADLEATLKYALSHEIPTKKLIDGERMHALKKFTSALASYFPNDGGNPMFLNTINLVVRSKETMSGEEFGALVTSTEQEMSPVFTERNEWIGCKPSKPGFRGYPCGLWTLFHTMTVNFARKTERANPIRILDAMHGYIEQFFGCADCSRHFVAMAAKNNMLGVTSVDDAVLWLWRAHNEVNARLAGDGTEDPAHKKIQYPTAEQCPNCRENSNGSWNTSEVLAYLKRKYSHPLSLDARTRVSSTEKDDDSSQVRRERLASVDIQAKRFRWDFTVFDISICVVLYVTSAAILMLVCIKFAVRRSHKRRMYVQSILGKV